MAERMLLAITAYNCEGRIVRALNQLDDTVAKYFDEVLVVNAASTDNTKEEVREYRKKHPALPLKLQSSKKHSGLGSAVKHAFRYAVENNYSYVLLFRGDNQVDIHDFLPVLEDGSYYRYDAVLGARFLKGAVLSGYSRRRIRQNKLLNLLFSAVCGRRICDIGSGYHLYSVGSLSGMYFRRFPDNNLFYAVMLLAAKKYRQTIQFIPVHSEEDSVEYPLKRLNQGLFLVKWALLFWLHPDSIKGDYRGNYRHKKDSVRE